MKKLLGVIAIFAILSGSAFLVSCEKNSPCDKAKNKCEECFTGTDLDACLNTVSACKLLPPGTLRNNCCEDHYDQIKDCQ